MGALEDPRERIALVEVEPAIIGRLGRRPAAVVGVDKILVGVRRCPARADGQLTIELPLNLAPGKGHRLRQGSESQAGCQCSERSEEHTSELQSRENLVCRLLLEKK